MPCLMLLLAGCSAFGAAGGATVGAGVGLLGGPVTTLGGAALGAFVGDIVADSGPSEGAATESVWSLMGKIVDAAPMLLILAIILWVLSLCAPSPLTWLKKKLKNRKQRDSSD